MTIRYTVASSATYIHSVAELDYALIADYAKAESGKLTVIGGSYTEVATSSIPSTHLLAIAGRVRMSEDAPATSISISIKPPDSSYEISAQFDLGRDETSAVYNGKVANIFALNTQVPLPALGLYEINISLDGVHARRLAFNVTRHSA